jgi:hypothetical protein
LIDFRRSMCTRLRFSSYTQWILGTAAADTVAFHKSWG